MAMKLVRHGAVAAEAFVLLAAMRVGLRLFPRTLLRGVILRGHDDAIFDARAAEVVSVFARVAGKHPLQLNCMHRALALQRMLARRGVTAALRVGLGRRPKLLPGHAWLEVGGTLVNDDAALVGRYVPFVVTESALQIAYSG